MQKSLNNMPKYRQISTILIIKLIVQFLLKMLGKVNKFQG